jgi:hypothetical protein
MNDSSNKACSICGVTYHASEFSYGNRTNRSYCKACNKGERAAYSHGGPEAARIYREEKRSSWKRWGALAW